MLLTGRQRLTLIMLGAWVLGGLGVLWWQHQRPAIRVLGAVSPLQAARWSKGIDAARRIDVNRADAAELERLPGVGPSLAQRIVAYRDAHGPFEHPNDVAKVRGIGPKTVEVLRDYIKVDE